MDQPSEGKFDVSTKAGTLYVVATPIGNLEDLSARAVRILSEVDLIAAEDTRHSAALLRHHGIETQLRAYHEFNEQSAARALLDLLREGRNIALISDAGTPLISDPGYRVVAMAHDESLRIVPVPGASAPVAALSASGLAPDRFCFEGYLPEKPAGRRVRLAELVREPRTLIFFEAPHRIEASLADMSAAFGGDRPAAIARELTKRFETVRRGSLEDLCKWLSGDPDQRRGEFVVVVQGATVPDQPGDDESRRILEVLLRYLSVKDAATVAAELTGRGRRQLYALALELRGPDRN